MLSFPHCFSGTPDQRQRIKDILTTERAGKSRKLKAERFESKMLCALSVSFRLYLQLKMLLMF